MVKFAATPDDPAGLVRTLAVLVHAGASPTRAWQHLAAAGDARAERVVARCADGEALPDAIEAEGGTWVDVAAAWRVASLVGAPLADVLRTVAEGMRDAAEAADDVRVALAEPAGTARLLLWMPFAGLLLGVALGFDTLTAVMTNPAAAICVGAGLLLVLAARTWTRRLLRKAAPRPGTPGIHAALMAVALRGGASIDRAREVVAAASESVDAHDGVTARTLDLARATGAPAVELLFAAAAEARHASRVQGRLRAAQLGTRLLIPLGVCSLPAFLLMGIAPLMISVLAGTPLLSPPTR